MLEIMETEPKDSASLDIIETEKNLVAQLYKDLCKVETLNFQSVTELMEIDPLMGKFTSHEAIYYKPTEKELNNPDLFFIIKHMRLTLYGCVLFTRPIILHNLQTVIRQVGRMCIEVRPKDLEEPNLVLVTWYSGFYKGTKVANKAIVQYQYKFSPQRGISIRF
jgi:hypothetical protein